ncbi:MAG: MFS transporter, partial [Oliverpabstia sp.]
STTFALGTLCIYFLAGILLERIGYQGIFFLTAGIVAIAGILFFIGFGRLVQVMEKPTETVEEKENPAVKQKGWLNPEIVILLVILSAALIMQGMLRDGVTSWVPSYLDGVYHKGLQTSTLATMVLPVVNLVGVYVAELIRKRSGKSEISISAILFLTATAAVVIMICFGNLHIAVAVAAFAVITSCMLGINTMIVNVIPVYFAWTGRISLISGILNSCVYIGSSLALYGIGAVVEYFSWETLLLILGTAALTGMVLCVVAGMIWKKGINTLGES